MKRWQLLKLADDNLLKENDIIICKYGITQMLEKEVRYINGRFINKQGKVENIIDLYNCVYEVYGETEYKTEKLINCIEEFNNEKLRKFEKDFIRQAMKRSKKAILIFDI